MFVLHDGPFNSCRLVLRVSGSNPLIPDALFLDPKGELVFLMSNPSPTVRSRYPALSDWKVIGSRLPWVGFSEETPFAAAQYTHLGEVATSGDWVFEFTGFTGIPLRSAELLVKFRKGEDPFPLRFSVME